jgi:cytochrome c peroxidase
MGVRSLVALVAICMQTPGLYHPASAQELDQDARGWMQGTTAQAQWFRDHMILERRPQPIPNVVLKYRFDWDPTGIIGTYQQAGATFTASNAFFKDLGTNGRTCFTCHQPQEGWSLSAAGAKARFEDSFGADPLFHVFDGATCPSAKVATFADKQKAYKLLIEKGLIRFGLPLPPAANLQFDVTSVDDPYDCTTTPATGLTSPTQGIVSVYRRPLPSANVGFLTSIMWDGREPTLESQATTATLIHAQAKSAPTASEQAQIVAFEKGLFSAQIYDKDAHLLTAGNATGGPVALSLQQSGFVVGVNDPIKATFDRNIFNLYKSWVGVLGTDTEAQRRRSVARGEQIFNSGFCGPCHNTPGVGNRSAVEFQDIGTTNPSLPFNLDLTGLPVFTLTCKKGPSAGQVYKVTDPGRALITGKCADIGLLKVPGLRGLSARAPYFHNGSAASLADVVEFYARAFQFTLTTQQTQDLVNFLAAL